MYFDYFSAVILGIIEGLTEFVPISSTGHLILIGDALSFQMGNLATFNIAIQLGAILSVVFVYKDRFSILINPKNWFSDLGLKIFLAILPALFFGFLLHAYIKEFLFSSLTVIYALIVGGIIMLVVDFIKTDDSQCTTSIDELTFKQACVIGIAQCFALWPGMSRSGSTIVGGLLSGLNYKTAADFSFIISVPVMFAAVTYDLLKTAPLLSSHDLTLILIGFVVSFVVAYFAIVTFLKLLVRFKLLPFAIYRLCIGLLLLFFYL